MVYIFRSLFVLREYVLMLVTSTKDAKLLKQGYRYNKIRKLRFYHRQSELIVKYNIGLKTLQQHIISAYHSQCFMVI